MNIKPPLPPFTLETAKAKVQAAEDAWNTRDPERVALAENWEFAENGLMIHRFASINNVPIRETEQKFCWERT